MQHYIYTLSVRNLQDKDAFDRMCSYLEGDMPVFKDSIIGYALSSGTFHEQRHAATFDPTDAVRWSTHEEDMIVLSRLMPDVTFRLSGEEEFGEERWEKYFQNGTWEACYEQRYIPKPQLIAWQE